MKSSRSGLRRTAVASAPRLSLGPTSRAPWRASSAGLTNSSKQTSVETGLPGSPNTSVSPRTPKVSGLPGRTATRQNTSSTPSSREASRTRSWAPTETPPELITTSCSSALLSAARWASVVSAAGAICSTRALELRRAARSIGPLESKISPGFRSAPAGRSSVPVARTATRGRWRQGTALSPTAASAPICAGPMRVPPANSSIAAPDVAAGIANARFQGDGGSGSRADRRQTIDVLDRRDRVGAVGQRPPPSRSRPPDRSAPCRRTARRRRTHRRSTGGQACRTARTA